MSCVIWGMPDAEASGASITSSRWHQLQVSSSEDSQLGGRRLVVTFQRDHAREGRRGNDTDRDDHAAPLLAGKIHLAHEVREQGNQPGGHDERQGDDLVDLVEAVNPQHNLVPHAVVCRRGVDVVACVHAGQHEHHLSDAHADNCGNELALAESERRHRFLLLEEVVTDALSRRICDRSRVINIIQLMFIKVNNLKNNHEQLV